MPSIADTTDSVRRAGIYVPDAPTMPSSKMPLLNKIYKKKKDTAGSNHKTSHTGPILRIFLRQKGSHHCHPHVANLLNDLVVKRPSRVRRTRSSSHCRDITDSKVGVCGYLARRLASQGQWENWLAWCQYAETGETTGLSGTTRGVVWAALRLLLGRSATKKATSARPNPSESHPPLSMWDCCLGDLAVNRPPRSREMRDQTACFSRSGHTTGRYHGGRRLSSDDSLHSPTVIPPSALDKPNIMKRYHRRRTTGWGVTARSPTMVTLHDTRFVECRWWNDGWTVKTIVTWRSSASMIPAPGTLLATLQGAWRYQVSARTCWPGVSILWTEEIASLTCSFYPTGATSTAVYALHVARTFGSHQTKTSLLIPILALDSVD